MRDYSTISPRFWIGHTGKKIKAMGADATIVALYLMTSPHANMLGLYYLPKYYLSHETGLTLEGASKGLQCCIEADFCTYDDASEVVWIFEMARLQLGEQLKPTDKRVIGIQNIYDKLPENPFLPRFYDKYLGLFSMQRKREDATIPVVPPQAPSKPLRSQEQEQDKEQEQETEQSHSLRSCDARAQDLPDDDPPEKPKPRWMRDFEVWYEDYPHKVGRGAAEKAFEQVYKHKRATLAELIAGRDRYARNKPPNREWRNPATWLNQKCWLDQPAIESPPARAGPRSTNGVVEMLNELNGVGNGERDYEPPIRDITPASAPEPGRRESPPHLFEPLGKPSRSEMVDIRSDGSDVRGQTAAYSPAWRTG